MADSLTDEALIGEGRRVLEAEARALDGLKDRLGSSFCRAARLTAECRGKVITSGVGKSGLIARKIASTLASLGRPSFFVHPTEGAHGDLGMLGPDDVAIAVSQSGNTSELAAFLTAAKTHKKLPVISIVGEEGGALAALSDVVLSTGVKEEACFLGLAPTTSSTAALALGDALAVAVSRLLGLEPRDFAALHPAGALGSRLYAPVQRLMRKDVPRVGAGRTLREAAPVISQGGIGVALVEEGGRLGVVTDGDIRRAVQSGAKGLEKTVGDVMASPPKSIRFGALGMDALVQMEKSRITSLVVLDEAGRVAGLIHLHDILRFGLGLASPDFQKGAVRDVAS